MSFVERLMLDFPTDPAVLLREAQAARVHLYQAHDKAIRYLREGPNWIHRYEAAQSDFDAALVALERSIDALARACVIAGKEAEDRRHTGQPWEEVEPSWLPKETR